LFIINCIDKTPEEPKQIILTVPSQKEQEMNMRSVEEGTTMVLAPEFPRMERLPDKSSSASEEEVILETAGPKKPTLGADVMKLLAENYFIAMEDKLTEIYAKKTDLDVDIYFDEPFKRRKKDLGARNRKFDADDCSFLIGEGYNSCLHDVKMICTSTYTETSSINYKSGSVMTRNPIIKLTCSLGGVVKCKAVINTFITRSILIKKLPKMKKVSIICPKRVKAQSMFVSTAPNVKPGDFLKNV